MKNSISSTERRILAVLQEGLPLSQTPYKDMADRIGIEVGELMGVLNEWKEQGKIRRTGAIVNHFKAGLGAGAMVVWEVDSERIEEVGKIFAGFEEVSHAYERQISEDWSYNVYTMVHGKSAEEVQEVVQRMSRACGVCNYRILVTEKELKKVPPRYIVESES